MGESVEDSKVALRLSVREALKGLTTAAREEFSQIARARLKAQPAWKNARTILFFAPLPEELDIWPLALEAQAEGKTIALPRFEPNLTTYTVYQVPNLEKDLESGQFGIREPSAKCAKLQLKRLDLLLVPGIAFDLQGHRLGRGKGFYDRLLATLQGQTCGVAFDQQIVEQLPVAPHDRHVNCILTPTRWLEF